MLRSHVKIRRYLRFPHSCRQCYVPAAKGPCHQRLQDAFCGGPTLPGVSRHVPAVHTYTNTEHRQNLIFPIATSNWNSQINTGDTVLCGRPL